MKKGKTEGGRKTMKGEEEEKKGNIREVEKRESNRKKDRKKERRRNMHRSRGEVQKKERKIINKRDR